jgi:hypothetical protein
MGQWLLEHHAGLEAVAAKGTEPMQEQIRTPASNVRRFRIAR